MNTKIATDGTGDLEVVFGTSTQKNHSWFFSTAPINKWARFKPFKSSTIFSDHYTGPNGESITSARLTAAANANYGLTAPSTNVNPATTLTNSTYNIWTYGRPGGGSSEPYRALDFEGYNHKAPAPVRPLGNITVSLSSSNGFSFGAAIVHQQAGLDAISWEDLPASIGTMYLCVIFSTAENCSGTLRAKTSVETINDAGIKLDITQAELQTLRSNNYKYYYIVAIASRINYDSRLNICTMGTPPTSGVNYMALPAPNNAYDLSGQFNIEAAASLSYANLVTMTNVQSPAKSNFLSESAAAAFIGLDGVDPSNADYYFVDRPYYIHFGYKIKAGSTNLTLLNPAISLSRTFFSTNGFSDKISCTMYNSNWQSQNQITITANTEQTIYFVASAPMLAIDQYGSSHDVHGDDQYFSANVSLYFNSVLVDQNNNVRFRNYSIT